jgi:hypothetical protein
MSMLSVAPSLAAAPTTLARLSDVVAQQAGQSTQPDLVPVVLWTVTAVAVAMLALTLGYLYRRTRGDQDEVIPKYVESEYGGADQPAHEPASAHAGH